MTALITYADVQQLLDIRTAGRSVLSLYMRVPLDPAELRELPARAHDLIGMAADDADGRVAGCLAVRERQVRQLIEARGRDWAGRTVAIVVGGQVGKPVAFGLPCELPDRAVLATRPHIRPMLVALQRCPVHYVVVVDQRNAWLFRVTGDQIETAGRTAEKRTVRSRGFSGWYGLQAHRVNDLVIELAHEHLEATVAMLERAIRPGWHELLVVGGHEQTIAQFARMLPAGLRECLAGRFNVDPHTMTPARVRDLASPVIAGWAREHEDRLTAELRAGEMPKAHQPLTVTGLGPTLAAVNASAVRLLVVPVGGIIGGYACRRCGTLSVTGAECADGVAQARRVPDLIEEMVTRTTDVGGQVEAVDDPPGDVAARLRFPLAAAASRQGPVTSSLAGSADRR